MNQLSGTITHIQHASSMMLVDIDVEGRNFSALMIQMPQAPSWLQEGNRIGLIFKETEVSLGKNVTGILSLRNQVRCTVEHIKHGELLSVVDLRSGGMMIRSAITTRSADMLGLQVNDEVTAYIKANEITLTEENF